jgi:hypothetical protein
VKIISLNYLYFIFESTLKKKNRPHHLLHSYLTYNPSCTYFYSLFPLTAFSLSLSYISLSLLWSHAHYFAFETKKAPKSCNGSVPFCADPRHKSSTEVFHSLQGFPVLLQDQTQELSNSGYS